MTSELPSPKPPEQRHVEGPTSGDLTHKPTLPKAR